MASFWGKPSQRHYGILTFSTSFLLLLRCIVFLSPLSLLNMQPIQHRPPATNAPGLFRHIIDAAIYHIVILLCAGFFGTFRCAVFKELLVVQQFRFWALQESVHLLNKRVVQLSLISFLYPLLNLFSRKQTHGGSHKGNPP